MPFALYPSIFFTVVLLFTNGYFLLGGLPLLVLKHDVPLDARFVGAFFNVYYQAAFWAAVGACLSFALWGRFGFAAGAAALATAGAMLRRTVLPTMRLLALRIEAHDGAAVLHFRRVHMAALLCTVAQLVLLVWGTLALSRSF